MALVHRRIGLVFTLFLILLAGAIVRGFWLGTVRGSDLRTRAVAQQVEKITVPAQRGTISDRNGVELAVSEDSSTVYANPFLIKDPSRVAGQLSPLVGLSYDDLIRKLADRKKGFVYLRRKIDPDR